MNGVTYTIFGLGFLLMAPGLTQAGVDEVLVADFQGSITTEQGGCFFCKGGTPAQVQDSLVVEGNIEYWLLQVTAGAAANGAGGVLPLYNNRSRHDRTGIDINRYVASGAAPTRRSG